MKMNIKLHRMTCEKYKDSKLMCVCGQLCNKILNTEYKRDKYFVDEVEIQLREKPLWGSHTQDIRYLENKASYKAVALTYPMQWSYLEL